jgi:ABC-type microcin C transport system duplicated ATPase subunit YejF
MTALSLMRCCRRRAHSSPAAAVMLGGRDLLALPEAQMRAVRGGAWR